MLLTRQKSNYLLRKTKLKAIFLTVFDVPLDSPLFIYIHYLSITGQ